MYVYIVSITVCGLITFDQTIQNKNKTTFLHEKTIFYLFVRVIY